MAPQPEPKSALAPASKDQSNSPAAPILPHESEPDFRVLLDALTLELIGPRLGFSRQFAYEAAVSRANITRLRQALNASVRSEFQPKGTFSETMRGITDRRSIEEVEAILKAPRPIRPPPLVHLERELEPLLDDEMRRFQEEVDLLYDLRFAEQRLSTMEQDLLDRCPAKKKGSAARSRARQGKTPQNSFIDHNDRLTKKARIMVGEAPLVAVESPLEYETNLREVMAFSAAGVFFDVLAAVDITNDTWQIRRLLQRREEMLAAATP